MYYLEFNFSKEKAGLSPDDDLDDSLLKTIINNNKDLTPSASDVPDSDSLLLQLLGLDSLVSKVYSCN